MHMLCPYLLADAVSAAQQRLQKAAAEEVESAQRLSDAQAARETAVKESLAAQRALQINMSSEKAARVRLSGGHVTADRVTGCDQILAVMGLFVILKSGPTCAQHVPLMTRCFHRQPRHVMLRQQADSAKHHCSANIPHMQGSVLARMYDCLLYVLVAPSCLQLSRQSRVALPRRRPRPQRWPSRQLPMQRQQPRQLRRHGRLRGQWQQRWA
jgi:hypothetical protein